jgi:hypothetical protein
VTGAPVTEAQAESAVVDYFRLFGWEVRRIREDIHNRDGRGLPDLLCTSKHGMQLWVEMKRPPSTRNPRGRVRAAQREVLIAWRVRGVPCCVLDGVPASMLHESVGWSTTMTLEWCDRLMTGYEWWPADDPPGHRGPVV